MMYIYYIGLKVELLEKNVITKESKFVWRASYDIYADANKKYGRITNLIRNILAPFAPAAGMAFSRNSYVRQEAFVLGLVMLLLGLCSDPQNLDSGTKQGKLSKKECPCVQDGLSVPNSRPRWCWRLSVEPRAQPRSVGNII
jgi:hypothetical protein